MVRGPVQGAFLVTGGPGTGKTSIALHRIPYLIWVSSQPQQDTGIQCAVEFSIEQTVVLVWKPHLVSYLRDCLGKLLNVQVPESNVRHIDKWVTDQLQSYVTFSTKGWRLDTPPVEVETVKKRLTEDDLYDFLRSPHGLKQKAEDAFRKALPEGLSPTLKSTLDDLRMLPRAPFSVGSIAFSVAGYQNTADLLRQQFPDSGSRFSESQNVELREIRRKIRDAVTAAMPFVSNYCQLLFDFYESQIFLEGLPDPERRSFVTNVRQQREGRKLSRFDTYVLLWLIHLITDGSTSGQQKVRPLPKLTHIVVDEAQYYEPLVLRLFGSLVDLPRGVLTIVGDLEQRFAHDGGIADWSEAGLSFDSDCRCHLEANYRWTPEIFQFLDDFGLHAEIGERLARPYKFRVDGGLSPEVFSAATRRDELDAIAEKISELKEYDSSDDWTIAVIVPKEMTNEVKDILMPELVHRFIDCEWPIQKNVKPTTDHVVFTDYNSVVGLEFDAVFCPAVDIPLVRNTVDDRQALWVALTRARKFVFVSHGQVPVLFDHADFDAFRTGASIENLDLPPDTIIPNDHDDPTEDEVDTAPAQTVLTWQAMTAKDWFVLSKWARENDQLNGWERRFSYSQGVRESDGGEPSKKQALKANQILAKAVEGGYQKDASASGETE